MTGNFKSNWSCRHFQTHPFAFGQWTCKNGHGASLVACVENLSRGISDYEVKGEIFLFIGLPSTLFSNTPLHWKQCFSMLIYWKLVVRNFRFSSESMSDFQIKSSVGHLLLDFHIASRENIAIPTVFSKQNYSPTFW